MPDTEKADKKDMTDQKLKDDPGKDRMYKGEGGQAAAVEKEYAGACRDAYGRASKGEK